MINISWTESSTRQLPEGGDAVDFEGGLLALDILEGDNYEATSLVTEHSVEGRAQITDHKVPQLDRVSFDVVVSESPAEIGIVSGSSVGDVELSNGHVVSVLTMPEGTTRRADVFEELLRLSHESIEITVTGLQRAIEGWLIDGVSSPRTVETAGLLTCTISIVEVSVAAVSEATAPSPRVERGRRSSDRGRQRPQTAGDSNVSSDPTFRDDGTQSLREDFYNTETGEF